MTPPASNPTPLTLPTIYECASCGETSLDRRCPDCNLFSRSLGPGGYCPHCDEPVPLTALSDATQDRL